MIDLEAAKEFLDFGRRIGGGPRAMEQLEGAVALHNILREHGVAYLADEVGMGKTYVALGTVALFRHFHPGFRVLVLAPRENIQAKWMKEFRNFIDHNVRYPDLRVKGLDGRSTVPMVSCGNLRELIHESTLNPNRDFFARLTSFSLPLAGKEGVDAKAGHYLRDELRKALPWLPEGIFDLRNRDTFKDHVAMALCCALPDFDLVIVDEGHNLKYGFESQAARNRVLGLAMGRTDRDVDARLFPRYGYRAKHVLYLSATPVEESYHQLWNQLDLFGKGHPFRGLKDSSLDEEAKKDIARKFLIRRVTSLSLGGKPHTKNLYRREWRRGGVDVHDEPIRIQDPRQKLVVALIQKKVGELLDHEKFQSSFQIGMLASFESFLQTAKVLKSEDPVFDDADQTDKEEEREGLDVHSVNRLAADYRKRFGQELPHPKMDALVDALEDAWVTGEKRLVFVRRVASVKELKRKLDSRYDQWLQGLMAAKLPHLESELKGLFEDYGKERLMAESRWKRTLEKSAELEGIEESDDTGGNGNFFEWYFRGQGPKGVISGANVQQRFTTKGSAFSTFFEQNHIAELLGCPIGEVVSSLRKALDVDDAHLRDEVRRRAARYLSGKAVRHQRRERFEAAQAAAMEWLKDKPGEFQERARIAWHQRFEDALWAIPSKEAPDCLDSLETATFFTELPKWPELREVLWPSSAGDSSYEAAFRESFLRGKLLATVARLGHAFLDLYFLTANRLVSLRLGTRDSEEGEDDIREDSRIGEYLQVLESQRLARNSRKASWTAFEELFQVSQNYGLILDVNAPEVRSQPLAQSVRTFATLLSEQQPVGGMSGQVNRTLIRQFRMPGYPLILVTTDLLQEGEDLHSFCSSIHHYGISWTPSSMEQRIGRIDRVRSQTERRLLALEGKGPQGSDWLQVFYPHLEDTVELLQVQKVLERINSFLRLMHEGIVPAQAEDKRVDTAKEFAREFRFVPPITTPLVSAFPIQPSHLQGSKTRLLTQSHEAEQMGRHFLAIHNRSLGSLEIEWEPLRSGAPLMGTVRLPTRVQPFRLSLASLQARPLARCISPIGRANPDTEAERIKDLAGTLGIRLGAVLGQENRTYDLTVEGDVLLTGHREIDGERIEALIRSVVSDADQLERLLLPGQDAGLSQFRFDLEKDPSHES